MDYADANSGMELHAALGRAASTVRKSVWAVDVHAANAQTQGTTEANSAAAAMANLGLSGTVIFYDMENYTPKTGDNCASAVQTFLRAWVSQMNVNGYATTAVYGNPGPAQRDFSLVSGLTEV